MISPRLILKLFFALGLVLLGNVNVAEAQLWGSGYQVGAQQEESRQLKSTPNSIHGTEVQTDGQCSLDDNAKRKLADQAYKSLYEAEHLLVDFNKSMMKHFEDENGSCHYLNTKLFDDAARNDMIFTETATAGAKVVDEFKKKEPSAVSMVNGFNRKNTYLGIDVRKLMGRSGKGDRQSSKLVMWSQNAKAGETLEIDEATSELLEEVFEYSVDCNYAVMTDNNGSFSCYQSSAMMEKATQWAKNHAGEVGAGAVAATAAAGPVAFWIGAAATAGMTLHEILNATGISVAFSCTKSNCSNGKGPLGEQVEGLLQQSEKCMKDLETAASQRDELVAKRKEAHNLLDVLSGNLEVHCTCETKEVNGEQVEKIKDCTAVNPDFIENNMEECPTVREYQLSMTGAKGENCLTCRLFHTILRAVQDIAQKAYDALASSLKGLLGIGFGIFIGYITLLAIASPAEQKLSKYLNDLTTQGFKVAIAIILLSAPEFVYGNIIGPLMEGGVEFGISLTRENEAKIKEYGANFEFKAENTYLQTPVLQNTVGAAVAFNEAASLVPAIGRSLICNSWRDYGWWDKIKDLFSREKQFWPRLKMMIEGAILYIFGMLIALAVGFYMLDCALQLGIVCAMMPFFVASWPFKITRSYTKQGWDIFLNTFFNFVVMGVIISATSEILMQALATGLSDDSLASVINSGDPELIMQTIEFGGLQMVMLVICCLIALKMSGEIQNVTNKLSGGLNLGISGGIGGTVGGAVTKATSAAVGAAAKAGKATVKAKINRAKDNSDDKPKNSSNNNQNEESSDTETSESADMQDNETEESEQ